MYYIIKANADTPDADGERVEPIDLLDRLVELSGRDRSILRALLRGLLGNPHKNRVYIAANAGSPARDLYGRGFVVRRITNTSN